MLHSRELKTSTKQNFTSKGEELIHNNVLSECVHCKYWCYVKYCLQDSALLVNILVVHIIIKKVHKINTKKQQNVHTFTLQVDVSHFLSQESCVSEFRSCEMKAVSYFPIVPRGNTRKFTSHSQVVTSPKLPCPRRAHSSYFSLFLYGT